MVEENTPQPGLLKPSTDSSGTNGPAAADDESDDDTSGPAAPKNGIADKHNDETTSLDGIRKKKKNAGGKKTMWVTIFRCFECGRHGHDLPKCRQCNQAYYCNSECQRKHWRKHRPVCRATVAALAQRATRERLARAVREDNRGKVEGAEDDGLCVICQAKPVDPVEVRDLRGNDVKNLPYTYEPIFTREKRERT